MTISAVGFGTECRTARSSARSISSSGVAGTRAHRRPGDDEAELVDRIGRVRHQDRIARRVIAEARLASPSLDPSVATTSVSGSSADIEAAAVIGGQRAPQPGNALADRIAMRARVLHRLDQLGDDMRRRRAVGIAHAEVDDVLAGAARLRLGRVDLGEDIGRQAADAVELTGGIGAHAGSRGLDRDLYQTRRAAATERFGVDLHGGSRHAGGGQCRGHRLGARQAEGQRRRLGIRIIRRGVAVAGDRDDAVTAPCCELLQPIGCRRRQVCRAVDEGHTDGAGCVRRRSRCWRRRGRSHCWRAQRMAAGRDRPGRRRGDETDGAGATAAAAAAAVGGGATAAAAGPASEERAAMLPSPALVSPAWEERRRPVRGCGRDRGPWGRHSGQVRRGGRRRGDRGRLALPGRWAALRRPAAPAVRFAPQRPRRPGALCVSARRRQRSALHRGDRRLGRRRCSLGAAGAGRRRRRRRLGGWHDALAVGVPGGGGDGGGGSGALAEQPRRGARRGRIGHRRRRRQMLRIGAIGDQRAGDVGAERPGPARGRLRRHRRQVRDRADRRRAAAAAASAISPPCRSCHQLTGLIDDGTEEQPDSSSATPATRRERRSAAQTCGNPRRHGLNAAPAPLGCPPLPPISIVDSAPSRRPDVACGGANGKDAAWPRPRSPKRRVQAARPGGDRALDGRHRRTLPAYRRRVAEAPGARRNTRPIR